MLLECVLAAHRYECSHCNKSCPTERLLRDHMRQHGNNNNNNDNNNQEPSKEPSGLSRSDGKHQIGLH